MKKNGGNHLSHIVLALAAFGLVFFGILATYRTLFPPVFGATFSAPYATHLGLDPHEVFTALIDEIGVQVIRLPIEWDEIEKVRGQRDFSDIDWYLNQAAERKVKIVLAVGTKVPRWPECQAPEWAQELPTEEFSAALFNHLRALVTRYSKHPALYRWQVENEGLFPFGKCPLPDYSRFAHEVELVRALDPHHPIQLTVSGEQQFWASEAKPADIIGVSIYRFAHNPTFGLVINPHPPRWYFWQALSINLFTKKVVISELQAEPWFLEDALAYTIEEAVKLFSPELLRQHTAFAVQTGLREISFWGVEWWFYLKEHGEPALWEEGKRLINPNNQSNSINLWRVR